MSDNRDSVNDRRASDVPLDLTKERETFVRSFLKRGVELTEELLHENDEMRLELDRLSNENARLRAQVASDDMLRDFIKKVEALEDEKKALLAKSSHLEEVTRREEHRSEEVERELNDLANLYIAAFQLHASLSVRRVVRHLQDMLGQLIGAYSFAIYVLEPTGKTATAIAWENLDATQIRPVSMGDGRVGEVLLTGIARIPDAFDQGTVDEPFAVIPMMVHGKPVGAIAITAMLAQKAGWASVDAELFKLLGEHAGAALIGANLFATAQSPLLALADLQENFNKRSTSTAPFAEGD